MRTDRNHSVRLLLSIALLCALLAAPQPARAAYSATLAGLAGTLSGDASPDTITIDVAGVRLEHDRFTRGDPDFADNYDFDTTMAGTQPLTATAGATLTINAGGGSDTIVIGSLAGHAGVAIAVNAGDGNDVLRVTSPPDTSVQIAFDGGLGSDELHYNNQTDSAPRTITITSSQVSIPQGAAVAYAQIERLTVDAGNNQNTINIDSTAAATQLFIQKPLALNSSLQDDVNIGGAGSAQNILGMVNISNEAAFSRLTVDDSADPTGRDISIADSVTADGTITGIAPATIAYSTTNQISRVTVRGGGGGDTFNISSADPFIVKALQSGGGDDAFVFADRAILTGFGALDGGDGADTLDYSAYTTGVNIDAGSATGVATHKNVERAIGGAAEDTLFSLSGSNSLLDGGPGADLLQGGSSDDILIGGLGVDTINGGGGKDTAIWNDGDGADTIDGGPGVGDRVRASGSPTAADRFTVGLGGGRLLVTRSSPVSVTLSIGTTEYLEIDGGGGADTITATGELSGVVALTLSGGAGSDMLGGSNGNDTLDGGDGDDTLDGGDGGSDLIEGGAGSDTVQVAGAATADAFAIAPSGARIRIDHSAPLSATLDIGTVETVSLATGGGDDTISIVPLAAAAVAVDGGPHSAGDMLIFDRQGLPTTPPAPQPPAGTISVPGRQPVSYVRIEKLNIVSSAPPRLELFLPIVRR